jgi:hypothetical protein
VSRFLLLLAAATLCAGTAQAADSPAPRKAEQAHSGTSPLSPEDKEVVDNLELLESMGEAQDLDLLMELAKDDDKDGDKPGGKDGDRPSP